MIGAQATTNAFVHPALFYRGAEEYVAGTVPFIRAGLAAGEPVAVAVPGPNLELLRAELGEQASQVRMLDMTQAGRNPGRIIPGVLREFADAHPEGWVRIIGEPIWAGRNATEYPACVQHEALINAAFRDRLVTILCPYDADRLGARVLADAEATHPVLIDSSGARDSEDYAPEQVVAAYNLPLPEPAQAAELALDGEALEQARSMAIEHATGAGLAADRAGDLELAVNELAANTLVHGGGSGTLRIWTEHPYLVCEVRDAGQITDPLVGRRPVQPGTPGGRGMLLVNYLADLLRLHTGPGGTTVRAYFAL